jgi:hypothetical protein
VHNHLLYPLRFSACTSGVTVVCPNGIGENHGR